MSAIQLKGKVIAAELRQLIAADVAGLLSKGIHPRLAVICMGSDTATGSYIKAQKKGCEEVGISYECHSLPENAIQSDLIGQIQTLNGDQNVHGILINYPLPRGFNESLVLHTLSPDKDVDGFHPVNVGRLVLGERALFPCTAHAVVQILMKSKLKIEGSHVVIVGRSHIVGKPLANILLQKSVCGNATVTVCHTRTRRLQDITRTADILIACAGEAEMITANMVREDAVVIDVGVNRLKDSSRKRGYRLVGDVKFDEISEVASHITPVPGGVGPMTTTMLLYNTLIACRRQSSLEELSF